MTSTVFKQQTPTQTEDVLPEGVNTTSVNLDKVEVPYLDYETSSGHPFIVEYFKLGDTWQEKIGGFPQEVQKIEDYIQDKIKSGDSANSINAAREIIKKMEKVNNLTKEERSVVKIEVLSNYIDFLNKNDQVKRNFQRYGTRT